MSDEIREPLKKAWEGYAESWDAMADRPEEYYTTRTRHVCDLIARHTPPCRTLDIGCANGLLSYALAGRGFDVYGTDVSENMVLRARTRLAPVVSDAEQRFRVGIDGNIPFEDGTFDLITVLAVMEYIPDHPQFIAKLWAALRPGGLVIASCVNPHSFFVALAIVSDLRALGPTKQWRTIAVNLLRTGYWSGGYLDRRQITQKHGAGIDKLFRAGRFQVVDELNFFRLPRAFMDRHPLKRSALGQFLARHLGWDHLGVYQKQ